MLKIKLGNKILRSNNKLNRQYISKIEKQDMIRQPTAVIVILVKFIDRQELHIADIAIIVLKCMIIM